MPQAVQAIQAAVEAYPGLPQVACFDTAFHRHMPRIAQLYPLPRHLADEGVVRYGFHGLSYEYILQELRALAPREAEGRVVIAHLGNGASMAAVRGGIGIDTTMGFTPAGGLMMGTRPGDLDPGVLLYLLVERGMTPAAVNELVNRKAGLLGVSGISADMRDLLGRGGDGRASRRGRRPVLLSGQEVSGCPGRRPGRPGHPGLYRRDRGARRPPSACESARAWSSSASGSIRTATPRTPPSFRAEGGPVTVRVMQTDEDLMIARHTRELLTG